MIERIKPTSFDKGPEKTGRPTFPDIKTVVKTQGDINNLQVVLSSAKKASREQTRMKESSSEAEELREEEGVAVHKKEPKKKTRTKTARQRKMERHASVHALSQVGSEHDEEPPLGNSDPNQLPPGLQKAYEEQSQDMQQFINWFLQSGDPKLIALAKEWQQQIAGMQHPPTAADATQLNMIMQLMQGQVSSLPSGIQNAFYTLEIKMYTDMKNLANEDVHSLTPQIAQLQNEITELQQLIPILQAAEIAAQSLANGNFSYTAFLEMGENIIALQHLLGELPANSPLRKEIQGALAAWGSLGSNNASFPPGMILGYALFLAEMHNYAEGGGTKQNIDQVWNYFKNFNTMGIPGLANALSYIQKEFPSPSMNPTDWSYTSDGHIQMNYNAFNKLLEEGLGKAISNMSQIAKELGQQYSLLENELSSDQAQLQQLQDIFNETTHDISLFLQFIQTAMQHVPKPSPGGGGTSGNGLPNSLTPLILKEIQGLLKLIQMLEMNIAGLNLGGLTKEVQDINSHAPNFTKDDLNRLNDILDQLNGYANRLPGNAKQADYWGEELDLFTTISQIGSQISGGNHSVYKSIEEIEKLITKIENGTFTSSDMQDLVNAMVNLMQGGQAISGGDSKAISDFLNSLMNVMGSNFGGAKEPNCNLYNVIVLAIQYSLVQAYDAQAGAKATESGLQDYINDFVSHLPNSGNPQLTNMEMDLEDLTKCSGPNALFQLFTINKDGTLSVVPNAVDTMLASFLKNGLRLVGGDSNSWTEILNELKDALESYEPSKNGISALRQFLNSIENDIDVCWAALWNVDSLQDLFRRVLINQFLPEQEQMLQQYSKYLEINNDAGGMLNAIMKLLSNIAQAKGHYAGPPTNDKAKAAMISNLQKDAKEITQALNQIALDIALLNRTDYGDSPDVVAAKKKLLHQLQSLQGNLLVAQKQIAQVQKDLSTGKGDLAADLDKLVNGDGSKPPAYPGGLGAITDTISGDSSDYASIGLTQEYMMQMIMSRVEQEIGIISSSMKTLHDAYMTFAQAINK